MSKRRTVTGAGLGLGAILAAPTAAQAEDIKVTNLNDSGSGSLSEAIADANIDADSDRVLFQSKLSGTITLDGVLEIYSPMEILGPGARRITVSGDDQSRVFRLFTDAGDDVTISGLTLTRGFGGLLLDTSGGAIRSDVADLTLSHVAVTKSDSDLNGGGIAVPSGSLTVESSTISGNTAGGNGGGIYFATDGSGELEIRSSTVSGNQANSYGGGAYLVATSPETAAILNATMTGNEAGANGGGGGIYEAGGGALIRGSIIAGNTDAAGAAPDIDDGTWPISFSLIGDTTGAGIDDLGGNIFDVDPNLKPLKNNGGPTDTHAFKKSPAKNKLPKAETPKSDQRGAKRKDEGDLGAYELVKCEGVIVNRVGTAKKDKLKGTKKKDGILGLGGNDVLKGKKGKDGLCGGKGRDKLKGGPGKDKLDSGPGNDKEIQ
jgi:hypothetical protein